MSSIFCEKIQLFFSQLFPPKTQAKSHIFQDLFNILRGEFVDLVAELALHRERFSFLCDLGQLFFSKADQGGGNTVTVAISLVRDLGGLHENNAQFTADLA